MALNCQSIFPVLMFSLARRDHVKTDVSFDSTQLSVVKRMVPQE